MTKISGFIVVTGGGRVYGPFARGEEAITFLEHNYYIFSGNSRVECMWDPAEYPIARKAA